MPMICHPRPRGPRTCWHGWRWLTSGPMCTCSRKAGRSASAAPGASGASGVPARDRRLPRQCRYRGSGTAGRVARAGPGPPGPGLPGGCRKHAARGCRRGASGAGGSAIGIPFGGGTDLNFAELNRSRPDVTAMDAIAFPINPQVHAADEDSMVETAEGVRAVIRTARSFAAGRPVVVSPISLRPRFNPDEPDVRSGRDVAGQRRPSPDVVVRGVLGPGDDEGPGRRGRRTPRPGSRPPGRGASLTATWRSLATAFSPRTLAWSSPSTTCSGMCASSAGRRFSPALATPCGSRPSRSGEVPARRSSSPTSARSHRQSRSAAAPATAEQRDDPQAEHHDCNGRDAQPGELPQPRTAAAGVRLHAAPQPASLRVQPP